MNNVQLKNPNVLTGHEGQLLQCLARSFSDYRYMPVLDHADAPKRGDIVMFIRCSDSTDDGQVEWIEILHKEKVIRLRMSLKNWMHFFIPWPHGGFIQT